MEIRFLVSVYLTMLGYGQTALLPSIKVPCTTLIMLRWGQEVTFPWLDWNLMTVGRHHKKAKCGMWAWLLSCVGEGFSCTMSVSLSSYPGVVSLKCYSTDRRELADILLLLPAVLELTECTPERRLGFHAQCKGRNGQVCASEVGRRARGTLGLSPKRIVIQ